MFSDPLAINTSYRANSFARTDAGNKEGTFANRGTDWSDTVVIRNSVYNNKVLKVSMNRHNVEYTRKTPIATVSGPQKYSNIKAYIVIEHDDNATEAAILDAAVMLSTFISDTTNMAKLLNNEA